MAFTEISLIDIGHRGAEADRECAQTLRDVCHRVGFFYVQNHGLSEQTAAGYLNAARQFFALPFVADLDADVIDGNLTCDEQIRYFATGNGFLGTSLDYLANIERHFEKLGIIDDDVTVLLHDTRAYVAAGG